MVAAGISGWVILGGIATLLGVVAVIGVAIGVLRSNISTTTVKLLQDESKALHDRLDTVEAAEADCKVRLGELEQKYALAVELATGRAAIETLSRNVVDQLNRIFEQLEDLREERRP